MTPRNPRRGSRTLAMMLPMLLAAAINNPGSQDPVFDYKPLTEAEKARAARIEQERIDAAIAKRARKAARKTTHD